jgi:photosystem II stability/assembly factor-like uncharacterized protein
MKRLISFSICMFLFAVNNLNADWSQTGGSSIKPINCLAVNGSNLFAGTNGDTVFLTANNGTSWTAVNTGLTDTTILSLVVKGSNLFAGTLNKGVFLSSNSGTSWTVTDLSSITVYSLAVNGSNLFAGTTDGGVYLSTNDGTSWTDVNTGSTGTSVNSLAVSGTNLFAGTNGGGVYLSTDDGTSWNAVNTDLTSLTVLSLAASGSNLFAGTDGGGVFLTINNGTSWTAVNTDLTSLTVLSLAVNGSYLFAGTDGGGVFSSSDNGSNWTAINTGLSSTSVWSLATNDLNLFAGTWNGGVWKRPLTEVLPVELSEFHASPQGTSVELKWTTVTETNNYGFEVEQRVVNGQTQRNSNWEKIGFINGAGTSNVPHDYNFVYSKLQVGRYAYRLKQIDNDGTYKYSFSVELEVGTVPKIIMLGQNYPNPFNPTTTIEFTLAADSKVSLKIYDILGHEVATLVNEELKAGVIHRTVFDAAKYSSGLYFYRLQTGTLTEIKKLILLK